MGPSSPLTNNLKHEMTTHCAPSTNTVRSGDPNKPFKAAITPLSTEGRTEAKRLNALFTQLVGGERVESIPDPKA